MKKRLLFNTLAIYLTAVILILASCKKEDTVTNRTLLETYINKTGHNMEITRYLNNLPEKKFKIANNDTLIIQSPDNSTADTTLTILHADSARVTFADAKTYLMKDTSTSPRNFLNIKKFISTISPSGQTRYLRFTFTTADYENAK